MLGLTWAIWLKLVKEEHDDIVLFWGITSINANGFPIQANGISCSLSLLSDSF